MAFSAYSTLSEVRRSLALLLNLGTFAEQATETRQLLDEFIRQAVAFIDLEAPWVRRRARTDLALVTNQSVYDFPDNVRPGRLVELSIVNTNGNERALHPGVTAQERAYYRNVTASGALPTHWEIVDEQLNILPAPDATNYPTLRLTYYRAAVLPSSDDDELPLDGQAVLLYATHLGREHYLGGSGGKRQEYEQYIQRLRPLEAQRDTIHMGGAGRFLSYGVVGRGASFLNPHAAAFARPDLYPYYPYRWSP